MTEIFKNVLCLSLSGGIVVCLMLCLKPIISNRLSAKWQYFAWLFAAVFIIVPFWKVSAGLEAEHTIVKSIENQIKAHSKIGEENDEISLQTEDEEGEKKEIGKNYQAYSSVPFEYKTLKVSGRYIKIFEVLSFVWFFGMIIFLLSAFASYLHFLYKKKKSRIVITEGETFEEMKKLLGIKRKIRLCVSGETKSPMLLGIFYPIVYLSAKPLKKESERAVLMHELVHFKHRDLHFKLLSLLINAVHWFNPFAYILSSEISKVCEIYCDATVTENLDENGINVYMKTIFELAENNLK